MMEFFQSGLKLKLQNMQNAIMLLPYKVNLNQEKVIFIAGVVIFSLMSSFVFWGPSKSRRKKIRNSTGINGLVNMGETCFLNTLLQALAASPLFCEWLERHRQSELAQALLNVMNYVNADASCDAEVPLYPQAVVSALAAQGWSMGMGQQDSHELFFALMSSLEEQTSPPSRPQDVLQELVQEEVTPPVPRPPQLDNASICSKEELNEISKPELKIYHRTEENPADSELSSAKDCEEVTPSGDTLVAQTSAAEGSARSPQANGCLPSKRRSFISRVGEKQALKSVPHQRTDFPFRGQQLSQLSCTVCSRASVVQHQAFDCLSLPLPARGVSSLEQLLTSFTAPEQVHGVQCDHCSAAAGSLPVKTTFVKQLTIGRLPKCLCIHIQRTTWLSDGQAYKRHDFVDFPEELIMDKFTYCHKERVRRALLEQLQVAAPVSVPLQALATTETVQLKTADSTTDKSNPAECGSVTKQNKSDNAEPSMLSSGQQESNSDVQYNNSTKSQELSNGSIKQNSNPVALTTGLIKQNKTYFEHDTQLKDRLTPRHRYKLRAVVVHLGEVYSGHFVTFRRSATSPLHADRWFCTSDEQCHTSSLAEVMRSRAYMLFYDKL